MRKPQPKPPRKPRTKPVEIARTLALAADAVRAASEAVARSADAIETMGRAQRERRAEGGGIGFGR